jgi:hypothetical protein
LLRGVEGAVFDVSSSWDSPHKQIQAADRDMRQSTARRYSGGSEEVLPLLEIGYALGIGLSHACIYREPLGNIQSPMLPGDRISLSDAGQEEAISRFVDWFISTKLGGM